MQECFVLLDEDEYKKVWDLVYERLHFEPSVNQGVSPFVFQAPFVVFDISHVSEENIDNFDAAISSTLAKCMGNEEYIYALDWQHSGFRFNPKISKEQSFIYVKDERYMHGGYNAYFPDYYPDGDYYFFISRNFDWGYLGHPWQQKVWVFGEQLIEEFEKIFESIGFVKCNS